MKNMKALLLFFAGDSFYSPSVCFYDTNFPYEGGHFIVHLIFKLMCSEGKISYVCF